MDDFDIDSERHSRELFSIVDETLGKLFGHGAFWVDDLNNELLETLYDEKMSMHQYLLLLESKSFSNANDPVKSSLMRRRYMMEREQLHQLRNSLEVRSRLNKDQNSLSLTKAAR